MLYHISFDIDFQRNTYGGRYIVVEGIDGCGKTTQVERLAKYFKKQGKDVVVTSEPRKNIGVFGKIIQEVLLSKIKIPQVAFQYLFSADRAVHHQELIVPSLKAGKIVISDRCFWSAVPYGIMDQMTGRKDIDYDYNVAKVILCAQSILSMYHRFLLPDYTFYLDLPVRVSVTRLGEMNKEKEIYEQQGKLEKIAKGYNWLLEQFPKEFTIIDATQPVEKVTGEIISKLT